MPEMPGSEMVCRGCDRVISAGSRKCACGRPTPLASFKERAEWEVKQWRAYQAKPVRTR